MVNTPNPILTEEEASLLTPQPEECFRRAVQRGAISLDWVTEPLAPHVAAAVRSVVTGERPPAPSVKRSSSELAEEQVRKLAQARDHPPTEADMEKTREFVRMQTEQVQRHLAPYPQIQCLLKEQVLDWTEAIAAANAIDRVLGRYLTGTRYAAP